MMENKKIRRILPLCLSAVIAAGATSVVDHITLKGDVPAYAGMFGDVNGDGVVNASDAALILQFAAWSGAGNDGDLAYYLAQRGIAQPTEPETVIPTEEVTEPPTEELTEPPTDPAEEVSDLYAALSAEWAKTGDTSTKKIEHIEVGGNRGNVALYQEKIYFLPNLSATKIMCYDIASKELTEVPTLEKITSSWNSVYFGPDGYIYVYDSSWGKIYKFDLEGNELGSIERGNSFTVSDTGYLFSMNLFNANPPTYFTPDLTEKAYPDLIIKDSHGLDNKLSLINAIGAYGSKCILRVHDSVTDAYEYYCFDVETETYTKLTDCPLEAGLGNTTKHIGKYRIGYFNSRSYVYDMESNTMLAEDLPGDFGQTYFGGSSNIQSIKQDNQLVFQRVTAIPGESEYDQDTAVEIGTAETSGGFTYSIYLLDDTRYLFADNAGIFLRTYEKGAEGEELVYRFEQ